jgi:hypothetical protein
MKGEMSVGLLCAERRGCSCEVLAAEGVAVRSVDGGPSGGRGMGTWQGSGAEDAPLPLCRTAITQLWLVATYGTATALRSQRPLTSGLQLFIRWDCGVAARKIVIRNGRDDRRLHTHAEGRGDALSYPYCIWPAAGLLFTRPRASVSWSA